MEMEMLPSPYGGPCGRQALGAQALCVNSCLHSSHMIDVLRGPVPLCEDGDAMCAESWREAKRVNGRAIAAQSGQTSSGMRCSALPPVTPTQRASIRPVQ